MQRTLTFMLAGARLVTSFCILSLMPGNMVVPAKGRLQVSTPRDRLLPALAPGMVQLAAGSAGLQRRRMQLKTSLHSSNGAASLQVMRTCSSRHLPAHPAYLQTSTTLPYRSLRISTSHFMMELKAASSMPEDSMPTMLGVKSTSGHLKRSLPMVIICAAAEPCSLQLRGCASCRASGRATAGWDTKDAGTA